MEMNEIEKEELEYRKYCERVDRFAGLAMQAMISSDQYDLTDEEIARYAYTKALAMADEREKWL